MVSQHQIDKRVATALSPLKDGHRPCAELLDGIPSGICCIQARRTGELDVADLSFAACSISMQRHGKLVHVTDAPHSRFVDASARHKEHLVTMRRHRLALLVGVLTLAVLLAGCTGPERGRDPSETAVTPTAGSAALPAPSVTPSVALLLTATAPPTATATATSEPPTLEAPTQTLEPTITPRPIPVFSPTATSPVPPTPTPVPGPDLSQVWTIQRFEVNEPVMVLTFDAGSDRGFAADILDILAEKGVTATFGMTGAWAEANPDLILRIVAEGHDLINHSWSHPDFTTIDSTQRAEQLRSVEDLVRAQTGVAMKPYFRPPYGAYNESVLSDLLANGYNINVMWTIDTLGWNGLTAEQVNQRVFDGAQPGAIVLMHVGAQSSDAAALPAMIDTLREMGYSFARVRDLAGR
jgi:peptidoglycan/xylan/chitin deacetylase (PgdA/CDA1 family)